MFFSPSAKVRPWRVVIAASIIFLLLLLARKIGYEPDVENAPKKNTNASAKQHR